MTKDKSWCKFVQRCRELCDFLKVRRWFFTHSLLWPSWFVAVMVCGRHGLWPSWYRPTHSYYRQQQCRFIYTQWTAELISCSLGARSTGAGAAVSCLAFSDDVLNLLPLSIKLLPFILGTGPSSLATVRHLYSVLERCPAQQRHLPPSFSYLIIYASAPLGGANAYMFYSLFFFRPPQW